MIKKFREICKMWIYSIETSPSMLIAKAVDVVVDPQNGNCVAIWVKTLDGLRLVDFRDIIRFKKNGIYVSTNKDLLRTEEFPKISHILEREVPIISANVFVKEMEIPRKIGKIEGFKFETKLGKLLSIRVNKGFFIFGQKVEIPITRIIEINEEGVFISNNLLKIEKEEPNSQVLPSLD